MKVEAAERWLSTVEIDTTSGDVTLTQLESLNHPNSDSFDEAISLASGALETVVTATDGDGDVASDRVDLGGGVIQFEDDGPGARITAGSTAISVDETNGDGDEAADPFSFGTPLGVASGNLVSAGQPKGVVQGSTVKIAGLVATPWSMGDRSGVAYRAEQIEPTSAARSGS